MPHSEKSADSAKESHTSKQEVAKLTTQLHNVTGLADWAQNRADFYWKQEKEYEAQGRVDMALEAKTMYEE